MLDGQNPSRSLFARAKERHVFLFEKVVIMSKKFEAPSQKKARKADNYLYKAHLPVSGRGPVIGSCPCLLLLWLVGFLKVLCSALTHRKC